jgi:hypothetical protein
VSNLILLCPECHKLVDDHPDKYTATVLRKYKKVHEDRVFMLTETRPDRQTIALVLKARIGWRTASVSLAEIQESVAPRYLSPRDVVIIDLTDIPDSPKDHYWNAGMEAIRSKTRSLYEQTFESGPVRHLSVFALGPIPLLIFLGPVSPTRSHCRSTNATETPRAGGGRTMGRSHPTSSAGYGAAAPLPPWPS